jgi:hypothetical protein
MPRLYKYHFTDVSVTKSKLLSKLDSLSLSTQQEIKCSHLLLFLRQGVIDFDILYA